MENTHPTPPAPSKTSSAIASASTAPSQSQQKISIEALAKLTGFDPVELRKLANRHYFPAARDGHYLLTQAITGCFRRRKEQAEAGDGLPTYDSAAQCNGQTGIPLSVLKQAKKSGCTAFVASRVVLAPLLRW